MAQTFGILTSLYDDAAPQLLKTIDDAIGDGTISADVPVLFCDRREGVRHETDRRIRAVRELRHVGQNIVFLPPVNVRGYDAAKTSGGAALDGWRREYDREAVRMLSDAADSFLNIGWMRLMTEELYEPLTIANLHPGTPRVGSTGMWPGVMEEQAERVLAHLHLYENPAKHLGEVLAEERNKAGGMIHVVTGETDRGPVISWYNFRLDTERLRELFTSVSESIRQYGIDKMKEMSDFYTLTAEIRSEQLKGEHPLLVLTYSNLSKGNWHLKDKTLHVGNEPSANGYCVNKEVRTYLLSRGGTTPIGLHADALV